MSTVFTRIINGEIPGRFIWSDEHCVAFLTAGPITPGHTLVVPRDEITQWTEATPELIAHLTGVAHTIGKAIQTEWESPRIGLLAQGFEVPHLHLHVWAAYSTKDFDLSAVNDSPDPAMMDQAAQRLRNRLHTQLEGTLTATHIA
ncbi:HIT domain-containing protein [Dermatophilus congolensis]|uniref:HIT domain-containing protein n=1 Tax=Dermatophilus congolensis TaxID=1863 RepID=UPI001AAEE597|nr:HIT family protein [Dermatophilus congolensis]MBO3151957.1 HIT family protein [Dermatophilus congolensis]MBO3161035.1 HIT family protein [Dermatophilus congolensis]MBO3163241.1 HIT family protein [Dermatophilus congolensis]MBO3176798.1 HIT family protein [Dermatophilus congolensis]